MVEHQKSAGLIVYYLDKNNKIKFLLLKYPTYWGFVKGLIEKNEKPKETALRELKEEANIKAEILHNFKEKQEWFFKFKGQHIKKQAVYFLDKTTKEEAKKTKISFEHEDFAWLNYGKAIKKIKIQANRDLLKKAYDFIKKYERQKKLI